MYDVTMDWFKVIIFSFIELLLRVVSMSYQRMDKDGI